MTDHELDLVIQRILIDAQKADEEQVVGEDIPFNPSVRYQHNMRAMYKNPKKWSRSRERHVWKNVMRRAAMILLAVSIGFGGLMASVPSVRAAVIQWVMEWYETNIVYRYSGDDVSQNAKEYAIAKLPSGFFEVNRVDMSNIVLVTYSDDNANILFFEYVYMHQGAASSFETGDALMIEASVNSMPGYFFEATEANKFNTLTWIDEQANIQFAISGLFDFDTLLSMATSVS